jgi:DNA-binding HxlR family transcriptional regulator
MKTYGDFCPISKAAEIFAQRWTPLILRELGAGSHRFSELQQGVPRIPRSLLSQRLNELEDAGVIDRRMDAGGKRPEYHLTTSGHEFVGIVMALGEWGQRWANQDIGPADVAPDLLMRDMRRRINLDNLPDQRVTLQFDFQGVRQQSFWLVLERSEPSVCMFDPGFEIDVVVTADTVTLHKVWMGRTTLQEALRDELITLEGPRSLTKAFPSWFALNVFAPIPSAVS